MSHLEVYWESPRYARFMRRLASSMRVLVFDKRGFGMSDRLAGDVNLETRADDIETGSGLAYEDWGEHELKGVPDRWRVYRSLEAPAS